MGLVVLEEGQQVGHTLGSISERYAYLLSIYLGISRDPRLMPGRPLATPN